MSSGRAPSIACIGIIGRQDNPLHISLFPSAIPNAPPRDSLEFQFLLNSSLDIFEARLPYGKADHDFGLLHAVDEQLAMYGYLTTTGVRLVIVVDMEGRMAGSEAESKNSALLGIRDSDLRPAWRAIHKAYVRLLRNPFYEPDGPGAGVEGEMVRRKAGFPIDSPRFVSEVRRVGVHWYPGIAGL